MRAQPPAPVVFDSPSPLALAAANLVKKGIDFVCRAYGPPISQTTVRDRNSISFRQPKSAFQLHHVTHRVVLPIHDERGEPYYMRTATLVVVLGFSICAQGEPVELTAKNFDKKVFSTKSALVKFQAPW